MPKKAKPEAPKAAPPSKAGSKSKPASNGVVEDSKDDCVQNFVVSQFVFRRFAAFTYLGAFLSLAVQAEALWGCLGVHPPRPGDPLSIVSGLVSPGLLVQGLALLGGALAGAAFLGSSFCERHARLTFAACWAIFAVASGVGASDWYSLVEDRLLLEMGVIAVLLVDSAGAGPPASMHSCGRSAAQFLLFRAAFTAGCEKLTLPCDAWRSMTAPKDAFQLDAFPLQIVWLLWWSPTMLIQVVACLVVYVQLVAGLFVTFPSHGLSGAGAVVQLLAAVVSFFVSNRGVTPFVLASLCLALLNDGFHKELCSQRFLQRWGCADVAESEDDDDDAEEGVRLTIGTGLCLILLGAVFWTGAMLFHFGAMPRIPLTVSLPVAVLGAVFALMGPGLSRANEVLTRKGAGLKWLYVTASLVPFMADLQATDSQSLLPAMPVDAPAMLLERTRVTHRLGRSVDLNVCPQPEGRASIVIQGRRAGCWREFSSRFLPGSDVAPLERPVFLAPFTPRIDWALWRASYQTAESKSRPAWLERLTLLCSTGEGAGARASAGVWRGLNAQLYAKDQYASSFGACSDFRPGDGKKDLRWEVGRALWQLHELDRDPRTNKWWNGTHVRMYQEWSGQDLARMSAVDASCTQTPAFLEDLPMAEALMSLIGAVFLGKIVFGGDKK